jgi:hypothetical protein
MQRTIFVLAAALFCALMAQNLTAAAANQAGSAVDAVTSATKTPPSISDIAGNFAMKVKGTLYNLGTGAASSASRTEVWQITALDPVAVNVSIPSRSVDLPGTYMNGVLVIGPPSGGKMQLTAVVVFSGSAPKIKATGSYAMYDVIDLSAEKGTVTGNRSQ